MASFRLPVEHEPPRVVRGRIDLPEDTAPFPAAVVVHGFSSFLGWGFYPELARRLVARGIAAVRFNHSCSGVGDDLETFDEPDLFARASYVSELEDLELVRRHVNAHPLLDGERVALIGHSRGGGMALVHAAEDGAYRAVVTWAAIDSILRFSRARLRRWREQGHLHVRSFASGKRHPVRVEVLASAERNRERLDIRAACGRARHPALVVQGDCDLAVPPEAGDALASAFRPGLARVLHVPGGDHTFGARHPLGAPTPELELVLAETVQFLARELGIAQSVR